MNAAWVNRWNIAAPYAPTPAAKNMYPSCEQVEYATTRLMSFCAQPTVAAKMQVAAPTQVTTCMAVTLVSNIGERRQTMNTPAVTMVAA